MTDNYASFEAEVRNRRKGRNLIVSRTKTPASAGYTGDRAGKVSGMQILPLRAYRAPGLACLKNNSKRRAASRLLTLERIRRANNHEPVGSERKRGRFTDTNMRLDVWQSVIFKSSTFQQYRAIREDHFLLLRWFLGKRIFYWSCSSLSYLSDIAIFVSVTCL